MVSAVERLMNGGKRGLEAESVMELEEKLTNEERHTIFVRTQRYNIRIRHARCQHAFFSTCIINLVFKKNHAGLRVKVTFKASISKRITTSNKNLPVSYKILNHMMVHVSYQK